jgi:hypothetical protein
MKSITSKQGFYCVDSSFYENKYEALLAATNSDSHIHYNYFDHAWTKFDRAMLGKYTLDELYRTRAKQLRAKYDYLILYFSGGADSYNVLRTFIDNGIKIDEVCVKWATRTLDRNKPVYTPNTSDITAANYLSEWDYAINPVLEELRKTNPEIKINIINWLDDRFLQNPLAMFEAVNHWHDIELPSLHTWSESEKILTEQGKKVGAIYGADKPYVWFGDDNQVYMFFSDACTMMGQNNPDNPHTTEYFYWSPDFRTLAFEMAFQTAKAMHHNPEFSKIKYSDGTITDIGSQEIYQQQQKKLRSVLYTNWTDAFQVLKPERLDRSDKHWWIYKDESLKQYHETFHAIMKEQLARLSPRFIKEKNGTYMYDACRTVPHFVCSISKL